LLDSLLQEIARADLLSILVKLIKSFPAFMLVGSKVKK